jgi:predicted methyltransferase
MIPTKLSGAVAGLLLAFAASTAFAEDAALQAAVASPGRPAADVARDGARHPVATLSFWGLKPRETVIELAPGGGYWSEILAPYAKATGGRYVAAVADMDNPETSEAARKGRAAFEARFADSAKYGTVGFVNFGASSKPLGPAGSADLVITARNIHNWMWTPGVLDKVLADAFAVLKPGGVLAVEEHRADPRPQVPDAKDGYVAVASVKAAAEKVGFVLDARSEINANPKDTKDHPAGVWTLPPTRQVPKDAVNFDHTKYDAIGESDRMTLRFRKPA